MLFSASTVGVQEKTLPRLRCAEIGGCSPKSVVTARTRSEAGREGLRADMGCTLLLSRSRCHPARPGSINPGEEFPILASHAHAPRPRRNGGYRCVSGAESCAAVRGGIAGVALRSQGSPENFLGKLVEFTATASHGFEDSMVEDSRCSWPEGGPGVWMEYGDKRSTGTTYCCGVTPRRDRPAALVIEGTRLDLVDDGTFRASDRRLHPKRPKPGSSDAVGATLRGRMFGRYGEVMGTQQKGSWRGYGHMGCCMLFVVTQVVSVDPPRR